MCRTLVHTPQTYVTITDQVMFVNQDPVRAGLAGYKSALIDLEARWGDRAEPERDRERLKRVDTER